MARSRQAENRFFWPVAAVVRASIVLFTIVSPLSTNPSQATELISKSYVQDASHLISNHKYQTALQTFSRIIPIYTLPCAADLDSVAKFIAQSNSDKEIDAVINNANYRSECYDLRGILYSSLGKYDLGLKDFNTALNIFPQSAATLCNKANLYVMRGDFATAKGIANKALQIEPKLSSAHKVLGAVLKGEKRYKEASVQYGIARALEERVREDNVYLYTIAVTSAAIKYNPQNPKLYRARAYISWDEHRARSESDYRKALALDPNYAAAYAGLGSLYLDIRDFKRAEPLSDRAVQLAPNVALFWYNRGVMQSIKGEKKKAMESYERAVKLEPNHPNYLRCRGTMRLFFGDTKGAMKDCTQSLKLSPEYAQSYILKAKILAKESKSHEAIEAASKAISLSPRKAESYQIRSQCYKKLGNLDLALADVEKASKLKPEDETIHLDAREVEALSGNLEAAMLEDRATDKYKNAGSVNQQQILREIDSYTTVIETAPKQAAPYYDRAILYAASGDTSKAIIDLQKFLQVSNWSGKSSANAVCLLSLFLREKHKYNEASQLIAEAHRKIKREDRVEFLEYLTGAKSASSLLANARGSRYETRIRLMFAIDQFLKSKIAESNKELSWIESSGDHAIDEFMLVSLYHNKVLAKQKVGK